jgi:hypothetical protein
VRRSRTMRQLTFLGARRLEWRDVQTPVLHGDGEALVRPIVSTTCDIDQWIIQGEFPFEGPFAIEHECVAEVLDAGERVSSVRSGDLVVVPWHISCGACDRCCSGRPAHCRATPSTASYGIPFGGAWGGTFDEVVRVPYADAMLVRLPDGIDPVAVAAAGDNLTIPVELLGRRLRQRPGATVLVLGRHGKGAGSVSLFAADIATRARRLARPLRRPGPDPAGCRRGLPRGRDRARTTPPRTGALRHRLRLLHQRRRVASRHPPPRTGRHRRVSRRPLRPHRTRPVRHVRPRRHPAHRHRQRPRTHPTRLPPTRRRSHPPTTRHGNRPADRTRRRRTHRAIPQTRVRAATIERISTKVSTLRPCQTHEVGPGGRHRHDHARRWQGQRAFDRGARTGLPRQRPCRQRIDVHAAVRRVANLDPSVGDVH